MCGIAGLVSGQRELGPQLRRMTDRIAHRGPDDEGFWVDESGSVGLGHRRLSILELSPLGHQPMVSNDGRWVLCFNGEIYNHAEMRAALDGEGRGPLAAGLPWRGHSDTETLVEFIAACGLDAALERSVGMFAFALWDRRERVLHLARDRFGEKPLYYGWAAGGFAFASELKSVRALEGFAGEIDRRAVALLAARTYIPAPLSIYRGVFKLPPGCVLSAPAAALTQPLAEPPEPGRASGGVSIRRYWSYREVVRQGLADPIRDEGEALERIDAALGDAIKGQSVADVPVGAFLSGGIDSSTVVALHQRHSSRPVRTFSMGFEEAGFNEAEYAKQVAAHLGTEHNERYVTVRETQAVIPLLPTMYDEPFADSSQIPTYLVSRFAREQVTVAISGDGGDELFGGYNRYIGTAQLWNGFKRLPAPLRKGLGHGLGAVPAAGWDRLAALLPAGRQRPHFGSKVRKTFRTMAAADGLEGVFDSFLDEWWGQRSPAVGAGPAPEAARFDLDVGDGAGDATRMMYCDAVSYLPDDILCKVDRAAMATSLETRVPFLDHRLAAVAARVPEAMKIRGGQGKHILRQLLYREAPAALFERPKAGFAVPVGEWIKGPLRGWAEDLLDPARMKAAGFFDPAIVQPRWQAHLRGDTNATPALWAVLMFEAWRREAAA